MSEREEAAQSSALREIIAHASDHSSPDTVIGRALQAVRVHLGLQVAYVSEFVGDDSVFRVVDAPGLEHLAKAGNVHSLDDVYCRHILAGRLPELIPDTAAEPIAMAMPITAAVPIGAHVSVPIRLSDGRTYGMFCCLGPVANPSLNPRDLGMMRAFADLAAFEVERDLGDREEAAAARAAIEAVMAGDRMEIHYQPIFSLSQGRAVGYEALARIQAEPYRSPDHWFNQASLVGMGEAFELFAIERALQGLSQLPDHAYLSVNASPAVAISAELPAILRRAPLNRVVLEVTEHDRVSDIETLLDRLAPLRADGLKIAVDDAGSGYSCLQQIVHMRPDLVKLDRFLIEDIQHDPGRRALAAGLMMFARDTGSRLIAEGVEREDELAVLRALGIDLIQGYLLGRPQPLAAIRDAATELRTAG
ncbi:EAL domain-containing protein [Sphingomonas sp. ST-64]|uniref:EAL domain-containing protein n=1 Tax=Sphingomonas plantiphila TaxID=3163295 RepID=A0ABW8YQ79_9SPHN